MSMDARSGSIACAVDVFRRSDKAQTAEMINQHLRWWRGREDNLVSWTSSLLFALVYIFHLHANTGDGSNFEDIFLCVADTHKFPDHVFIRDMDLVEAFQDEDEDLRDFGQLRQRYYFGEYLTQGALKIEGRCKIVSAQRMVESGLYRIRPEFENFANWARQERPPGANTVGELRASFECDKEQRQGVSRDGLEAALAVGQLFDAPWRLPMAASLVALAGPRTDDDAILMSLAFRTRTSRDADEPDTERGNCSLPDTKFDGDYLLPEVNEYKDIMSSIYQDYYLREFKEHLGSAEAALRNVIASTLNPAFMTHENSETQPSFSSVDVSRENILNRLSTVSMLSSGLEKRLRTKDVDCL
ncbi:hypothetical protein LLEC1_02937 [Akanthomyces lecanii]|uniref:Uncharacterized protein n=1 Tax=Cordyceps confragosa TaxID=2714763 RepID=A0A179IA80_CORDF|nr:hypothetical protein LLEC1_02937 [Akanthomyces lecanii]